MTAVSELRPGLRRSQRRRRLTAYGMLAPALLGLVIFFVYPLIASVVFSFTRYDLLSDPQWIGLRNYEYLFTQDPKVWIAAGNTLWFVLFLVPVRSWVRKGVEAYLTVLLEALWPKKRILEAYLNLVDWGHGNFGAEAAARAYFGIDAARLNRAQAARLAAILPDPDKWSAARPGPYVARRTETLIGQAAVVSRDNLDFCVK